ncbi:MAG: hypothetical protein HQM03_07550 [Magnetococcales bacterium]|nr:hypothetical protein [Magnetococcales bacterium]
MPEQEERPIKTRWHRLLGAMLEEALTPTNITVRTEVDVTNASPKADIILLRREGDAWTEAQKRWMADGLRDATAKEELLEFKFSEGLTEKALLQTLVYDHLYRGKQNLPRHALQSFLLLAQTPLPQTLRRFGFAQTDKPGVLVSTFPLLNRLRLILLNELMDKPHNAVLKCFASRPDEWHKAFASIEGWHDASTSLQFDHIMLGIRRTRMNEAVLDQDEDELTVEDVIAIGREWAIKMLAALPSEELPRLPGANEYLQKVRQEAERAGERIGMATSLMRQLQRRFPGLPDWVENHVMTADQDALHRWTDRILDARDWQEVLSETDGPATPPSA